MCGAAQPGTERQREPGVMGGMIMCPMCGTPNEVGAANCSACTFVLPRAPPQPPPPTNRPRGGVVQSHPVPPPVPIPPVIEEPFSVGDRVLSRGKIKWDQDGNQFANMLRTGSFVKIAPRTSGKIVESCRMLNGLQTFSGSRQEGVLPGPVYRVKWERSGSKSNRPLPGLLVTAAQLVMDAPPGSQQQSQPGSSSSTSSPQQQQPSQPPRGGGLFSRLRGGTK